MTHPIASNADGAAGDLRELFKLIFRYSQGGLRQTGNDQTADVPNQQQQE